MKRLAMLAAVVGLVVVGCAAPPDSGQAAGPTPFVVTAPSEPPPAPPSEPTAAVTAAPADEPTTAAPSAPGTTEATGAGEAGGEPTEPATTPAPGNDRGAADDTGPPSGPPEGPPVTPPGRPAGPPPGLPTLPDHVVRSAGGRGVGTGPPEIARPPSDLAPGEQGELARAWAGAGPRDWRVLAGFVGSQWDQDLSGDVEVLTDTITVRNGVATGLVRNERDVAVGPIVVSAAGTEATAMVPVARPGEPVPFRLVVGDVDAAALAWSASAPQATGTARDLLLVTWWQRGVADPRPADTYLWTEPDSGPQPIVTFGTATAVVDGMDGIEVVGAWVDDGGRVIGVAEATVGQPTVPAGGVADFVVATTGTEALDTADLMLWGWGE